MTTFAEEKAQADRLHVAAGEASKALNDFLNLHPRGPMNLVPDYVKAMAEYQRLDAGFKKAFAASRAFNGPYAKRFKKEIAAETAARRAARAATFAHPVAG